jgi:hypothetical protein
MPCALAAVDMEDLAGHKAGGFEVEDCLDDVADLAHALHRVERGQEFVVLQPMHRGLDDAGGHGIHPMPFAAYSMASAFVAELMPPLVRLASMAGTPATA